MDGTRFDRLLRQMTRAQSRRSAVLGALGGAVSLGGLIATDAKHHKKKKKQHRGSPPVSPPPGPQCPTSCPVCQPCVKGQSCTPQANGTACGDVSCQACQGCVCVNLPDETPCQTTGLCGSGTCNRPPTR